MKKLTFGTPETHVPSRYCPTFHYTEGPIRYPVSEILFRTNARGCVLEFPCDGNEQFYGLGLQLKAFNLTGGKFTLRPNADPVAKTGDSHAPVPFFVSTAGYGIYIDTARQAEFYFNRRKVTDPARAESAGEVAMSTDELYRYQRYGDGSYVEVQIPAARGVDIYIMEGETISQVVAQYNMLSGGGCLVPEWGLGLLYRCCSQYSQEQIEQTAKYFIDKEIPCDIIGLEPGWQTMAYSCSFEWNRDRYPDPEGMLERLRSKGYHVSLWEHAFVNPGSPIYPSMVAYSGSDRVWNGLVPDFSFEQAREIFARHHVDRVNYGIVDGYKLDECDGSDFTGGWSFPQCSEFPSGMDGEQYHALFGVLYMQTMLKTLAGKQTLSEVRNAGALCAPYPFVLYSDLYDHKDFIRGLATAGFSGLLWTPEVRHAGSKEELLRRLQSVVFSPQCLINGWYCSELPWLAFDCEAEVRELMLVRKQLVPRLMAAFERYHETGIPPVRALVSDYTSDPETYGIDDEYLLGDDLLVAPIAVGETGRRVYLPEGAWSHYFTGERVSCGWHEVETDSIPVYVKE